MKWRPHTEKPATAEVFTALIARRGDDGEYFLLSSIHYWKAGEWIEEATGKVPDHARPFWWLPESEVLESLTDDWALKGDKHEIEPGNEATARNVGN